MPWLSGGSVDGNDRGDARALARAGRLRECATPRGRCRDPTPDAAGPTGGGPRAARFARGDRGRPVAVSLDVRLLPARRHWITGRVPDRAVLATQGHAFGGRMSTAR